MSADDPRARARKQLADIQEDVAQLIDPNRPRTADPFATDLEALVLTLQGIGTEHLHVFMAGALWARRWYRERH